MRIVDAHALRAFLHAYGLKRAMSEIIEEIDQHFKRWSSFEKCARHATHFKEGVIELMPCSDAEHYGFKYVNGHPSNPQKGYMSVMGFGVLSDAVTGYPLLFCEMTWLTAIRTACTTAWAARLAASGSPRVLGLIGVGAQAEFLLQAMQVVFPIETCYFYDPDPEACRKFEQNQRFFDNPIALIACPDAKSVCEQTHLLVSATAVKANQRVIEADWVKEGTTLCAIGGDCPGKTELDPALLQQHRVLVEYLPQSTVEGDIQLLHDRSSVIELWQVACGKVPARLDASDIVIFDSVGFALEDLAALRWLYRQGPSVGEERVMVPEVDHPKDLFAALMDDA